MVKTHANDKKKLSIPSAFSVWFCYGLYYFCIAFGIGMLVLAIYGVYAEKTHAVQSAIAVRSNHAGLIQALVDIYPALFCVTAYFFFVGFGTLKIARHRKDMLEMAKVLRGSRKKTTNEPSNTTK